MKSFLIILGIAIIAGLLLLFVSDSSLISIILSVSIVGILWVLIYHFLPRNEEFVKNLLIAAGAGITIISWFAVGYVNNRNEIKKNALANEQAISNSKRELRIRFLMDAYFRLENLDVRQ